MELKEGYKNTELGLIPEDWEHLIFEDVVEGFSSGMTPYRGNKEYYTGNIPWITSGELNYNTIYNTLEKITPEAVDNTGLKILPIGTFLMAITGLEAAGTRGSCAITGIEATTNQSCMALFPKKEKISIPYLYHFYIRYGNQFALKFCQGTKQQSYTGKIVKILPINLPPLPEQKAIAEVLTNTDQLLQALEKRLAKKRLIKQGVMQELLKPKEDWVEMTLGEIAKVKTGSKNNQDKVKDGQYPFFVRSQTVERLNTYSYNCEAILVPGEGGIGNIYHYINGKFDVHQRVYMINCFQDSILGSYVYFFMKKNFAFHALKNSVKATVDSLRLPTFLEFKISLPTKQQQIQIATILSDMDQEIEQLEQQLAKYKQIKQGLMQNLLTGKIRLV